MALTFFKTPKNKQFNYRPVFYDKKKEEREKREKAALEENTDDYAAALRDRLNMRWKRTAGVRSRRASNQRIIMILIVMFVLLYFVFIF